MFQNFHILGIFGMFWYWWLEVPDAAILRDLVLLVWQGVVGLLVNVGLAEKAAY